MKGPNFRWVARSLSLFLLFFLFGVFPEAFAATSEVFPKKEVTIVVNYGPGGARDVLARGVASTMTKYLKVPVVIMNEPGGGGSRGLISIYHAPPDGYTIGIGTLADIISQILEKQEFDCKAFTYIGNAQHTPPIWSVRSDSPIRSTKDFKTFGKVVRHSAFSVTSNSTVAAMIVANRENFPLVIVGGYKSAADAILAVIRGEVEFSSCAPSVAAQYLKSGQLRPILAIDNKRPAGFPNIPTVAEAGHPDLALLGTDYWVIAPPRLPKDRLQILEDALMKTLEDPDFLKWAKGANVDPSPLGADETTKKVISLFGLMEQYKGDIEKYSKQ